MNHITDPVEYPPFEGGPGIVDSLAMYLKAIEQGIVPPMPGESLQSLFNTWFRWAQFPTIHYKDEILEREIKYWKIPHDQPPFDCAPGKNRVSLFDDGKSFEYETTLLERFNVGVSFIGSVSVAALMRDRASIDTSYVLKDPTLNKGVGKILVEDSRAHRLVMNFLRSKRKADVEGLIAEPFCDSPSDYNSTFRVTITPGGTIHGATITRSALPKNSVNATERDAGQLLAPLVNPRSPYFINSPRIASNIDGDKSYIGLDFPGRWYELVSPTREDELVLADHGIDPFNPVIPKKVLEAAVGVGRVLGPGIGMHIGIDLIMSKDGQIYLLETNFDPEYTSIFKTMSHEHEPPSNEQLRALAFRATLEDLTDGVFSQTEIAA